MSVVIVVAIINSNNEMIRIKNIPVDGSFFYSSEYETLQKPMVWINSELIPIFFGL